MQTGRFQAESQGYDANQGHSHSLKRSSNRAARVHKTAFRGAKSYSRQCSPVVLRLWHLPLRCSSAAIVSAELNSDRRDPLHRRSFAGPEMLPLLIGVSDTKGLSYALDASSPGSS